MSDTLFENYEMFIREHADEIGTPNGMMRMLYEHRAFQE